ncbi:MAG: sulfite exporter TauE/SafE family protein, partial [Candidatus Rokubacteria bacterium]|nr:sulfite exporter TauE/SafE family protein [Candidatus Rokubacteria bacterium]
MYSIAQVAVASLLGSLHCVGMCGPLVAFAVGDTNGRSWPGRAVVLGLYHGGRLVAYTLIGAACGLLGAGMDSAAARVGLYRTASVVAGAMMIGMGAIAVLQASGMRLPRLPARGVMRGVIVGAQRAALALRPFPRALCVGLLTALLPCGWLYVFAIGAAGTGSPLRGMLVMA